MIDALVLVGGLVVLVKGADLLVQGAASIAIRLRNTFFIDCRHTRRISGERRSIFLKSGTEHQPFGWRYPLILFLAVHLVSIQDEKRRAPFRTTIL